MSTNIIYAEEKYFKSFRDALDTVAREEIFIEMIEAKPLEDVASFQRFLIAKNLPNFYALEGEKVVGWVDITPPSNPRLAHRGFLGMGLLPSHRGQGLGTKLLTRALEHARSTDLEKIELSVYAHNEAAIKLYRKCGFTEFGKIKHYRKLKSRYFDSLEMELFL